MGLGSLVSEPARLEAASKAANEELEALVMDNYRVFIENLTCSVELRVEDAKLNKVFNNLGGNLEERASIEVSENLDRLRHSLRRVLEVS